MDKIGIKEFNDIQAFDAIIRNCGHKFAYIHRNGEVLTAVVFDGTTNNMYYRNVQEEKN